MRGTSRTDPGLPAPERGGGVRAAAVGPALPGSAQGGAPPPGDWRECLLAGLVVAGVMTTILTEALGAAHALRPLWVWIAWAAGAPAAAWIAARGRGGPGALVARRPEWPGALDGAALAWVILAAGLTGLTAFRAVPANYDSLTYHLARVAHWAQNQSVGFYPTNVIRQVYQPPWAEYAILHLYLMTGGDDLANLVQWVALLGCLAGTSLIARELGAGRRGQILAALVCATIPMGVLQASSTQNDYVVALWLVCLAHALLAARSRPDRRRWPWIAGASLGLALLTKGTAYIYAPPLLLCLLLPTSRRGARAALATAGVIVACAAMLNGPHWARNAATFGFPLGPGGEGGGYTYRNSEVSGRLMASNLIRSAALHLGTPWTPLNRAIESGVERLHSWMDLAPDDPRNTWPGTRLEVTRPRRDEDRAGNGLHLLLLPATALAALVLPRLRPGAGLASYAVALVAAAMLFSLLVKWQPWHSRLQLPLFVLAAPLVGVVLARASARLVAVIALALAASSLPFLVANSSRTLVGHRSVLRHSSAVQAMAAAMAARPEYVEAARVVLASQCPTVGLAIGGNDPEYVIWRILEISGRRPRIEHVLVYDPPHRTTVTSRLETAAWRPCAVIVDAPPGEAAPTGMASGYRTAWSRGTVTVLLEASAAASPGAGPR